MAPVLAAIGPQTVAEETLLTFTATATDSDLPAQPLTFSLADAPAGASIDPASGVFTWTPTEAQGPAQLHVRRGGQRWLADGCRDDHGHGQEVNAAPVAVDDTYTTNEDTSLVVAAGALGNDSDADGDALTLALETVPQHGAGSISSDGSFVYTPEAGWSGTDSFSYRASDGTAVSEIATVTITVTAVNDVPVVQAGADAEIDEGATLTRAGSFTDPDEDDVWTATVDYGDGLGEQPLVLSGKTFALQNTYADSGRYTVTVTVTDSYGASNSGQFHVEVFNIAPTAELTWSEWVSEGTPGSVGFRQQYDPSAADTAAGLRYSYDFEGDGTFEVVNVTAASATIPASYFTEGPGSRTVRARIADQDGGFTDYVTTVRIVNAPPTVTLERADTAAVGTPFLGVVRSEILARRTRGRPRWTIATVPALWRWR